MSIEKLEYFYMIARFNSLSQASKELHVSISSLSSSLKSLEQEIGTDLFERHGKKIILSTHGKSILPSVELILAEAKKLNISLNESVDYPSLRVGTSDASFIFEANKYPIRHQNFTIDYRYIPSLDLLNKLSQKEIDFAITSATLDHPKFIQKRLATLELKVAISNYFVKPDGILSAEVLEELPFIFLLDHVEHQVITKKVVKQLINEPKYVVCPDSLGAAKMITEGKGMLLANTFVQELLAIEPVCFVSLPTFPTIHFYLYKNSESENFYFYPEVEKEIQAIFNQTCHTTQMMDSADTGTYYCQNDKY
ncbi:MULTISPECIES: LysR family transcriptional regulator [Enterococcus]|uniref:LysR family transcriptional regulator n=1 Tax=Enterococcus TaxID=1350 RepID=UPI0038FD24A5